MHKNNRILVVDDEEFCIAAMKALLFKMGIDIQFQVDYAINGLEALSLVEEIKKN
jgi:CheY-like chemotaxis protein